MFAIPRRYSHFVFAVIQSGLTSLIAAGIASLPVVTVGQFLTHWAISLIISWMMMLPVVVLADLALLFLFSLALFRFC